MSMRASLWVLLWEGLAVLGQTAINGHIDKHAIPTVSISGVSVCSL